MARDHRRAPSTARRPPRRDRGRRFLIVCEGETEEAYFKYVQRALREPGVTVRAFVGKSSDPVSVVDQAALNAERAKGEQDYEEVWAVFDHDGRTARVRTAQDKATIAGVHVALSNPSFEVWLLWHHIDFARACDQREVVRQLATICGAYDKGSRFDSSPFEGRARDARLRSERMRARHEADALVFPDDRPGTQVDVLIGRICSAVADRRGVPEIDF